MSHFDAFTSDELDEAPAQAGHNHRITSPSQAIRFLLAGRATVTFKGRESRFTYEVSLPKDKETGKVDRNCDFFFVSVLTGPSQYQYIGYIRRGVFFWGRKSKIGEGAMSVRAFIWTYKNLLRDRIPEALEVWHEGACGRCGRLLTVPESIASALSASTGSMDEGASAPSSLFLERAHHDPGLQLSADEHHRTDQG